MTFINELSGVATKLAEARTVIERGAAEAVRVGPLEERILYGSGQPKLQALVEAGKGLRSAATDFDRGAALVDESRSSMADLAAKYPKQGADLPMVSQLLVNTSGKVSAQATTIRDGMQQANTLAMWPKHATLGSATSDINIALTMLNELGAAPAATNDAARAAATVGRNVA